MQDSINEAAQMIEWLFQKYRGAFANPWEFGSFSGLLAGFMISNLTLAFFPAKFIGYVRQDPNVMREFNVTLITIFIFSGFTSLFIGAIQFFRAKLAGGCGLGTAMFQALLFWVPMSFVLMLMSYFMVLPTYLALSIVVGSAATLK